jgi:hypothetical protein
MRSRQSLVRAWSWFRCCRAAAHGSKFWKRGRDDALWYRRRLERRDWGLRTGENCCSWTMRRDLQARCRRCLTIQRGVGRLAMRAARCISIDILGPPRGRDSERQEFERTRSVVAARALIVFEEVHDFFAAFFGVINGDLGGFLDSLSGVNHRMVGDPVGRLGTVRRLHG